MDKEDDFSNLNKLFGEYLISLMQGNNKQKERLSYQALASKLRKPDGKAFPAQYLHQIARGEIRPSISLIEALASYYQEDIERLRCLAGRPSNNVLLALAHEPEKYLAMMLSNPQKARIAVTSVAWAVHVLMTEDIIRAEYPTIFECTLRITGRSAIEMLINDEVQFAVVTNTTLERAEQVGEMEFEVLMDFTMSTSDSLYYLYKLQKLAKRKNHKLPYGALSKSTAEGLAMEYAQENKLPNPEIYDRLQHMVTALLQGKIAGFHGWPFLNLHAEKLLCEASGVPYEKGHIWTLEASDVHHYRGRVQLRLIAKRSFLNRDSSTRIIRDLAGKLIIGREQINKAKDRVDFLYKLLSRKLLTKDSGEPYIHADAVAGFLEKTVFDVNISSSTFQRLIAINSVFESRA